MTRFVSIAQPLLGKIKYIRTDKQYSLRDYTNRCVLIIHQNHLKEILRLCRLWQDVPHLKVVRRLIVSYQKHKNDYEKNKRQYFTHNSKLSRLP